MADHSHTKAVTAFAGHAIAGTAIFFILALLAFGIEKFIHLLEHWGADGLLITTLTCLEYVLLGADALSLLFFVYSAIKAAYEEIQK
ncbi:hypothetical protein [Burkholderia multivorans]|uniref:hypothetical protein n=1 Tax=Burkholderia multivorans TaxID=87883 RepID=UPI000D011A8A|nr:hypothetical protein [Burkholderia multivorans]MBH9660992.1 hypothetical protein [Burkholderia multivorans]PRF07086.1 hypothetical protein C6Q01_17355 [Burkholderia multivorans]PRF89603.1 hypothetical protein C6Q23_14130 [Burkholderia multivorans]